MSKRFQIFNYRGAELWDDGELVLDVRIEKLPEGGNKPYGLAVGRTTGESDIHSFHATTADALAAMSRMLSAAREKIEASEKGTG